MHLKSINNHIFPLPPVHADIVTPCYFSHHWCWCRALLLKLVDYRSLSRSWIHWPNSRWYWRRHWRFLRHDELIRWRRSCFPSLQIDRKRSRYVSSSRNPCHPKDSQALLDTRHFQPRRLEALRASFSRLLPPFLYPSPRLFFSTIPDSFSFSSCPPPPRRHLSPLLTRFRHLVKDKWPISRHDNSVMTGPHVARYVRLLATLTPLTPYTAPGHDWIFKYHIHELAF